MITISHFHFGLIIFLVGVFSVAVLIAIMEILGREAKSISKPTETLCPNCEAKEILSAAKDLGHRERKL